MSARCFLLKSLCFLILSAVTMNGCDQLTVGEKRLVTVQNEQQFIEALQTAKPGTTIQVADGDYSFDAQIEIHLTGTEDKPITIRAENRGKARIVGEQAFDLVGCSYVTIEGFTFNNRANNRGVIVNLEIPRQGVIRVLDSDHCRLTRLHIELEEKKGFTPEQVEKRLPRMHWVNITGGEYNRFDHCRLSNKRNHGITMFVGDGEKYIQIDHNHFDNRPLGYGNGFETLRLGTYGRYKMESIIEYNLFENCDGEPEIVSFKSSHHCFQHNTIHNSQGQIVCRDSPFVKIAHNFFINTDPEKENVGGVRIHSNEHKLFNNYFEGLTGPGLSTFWGDMENPSLQLDYDEGVRERSYQRTSRAHIAFNTWVNCARFLHLGVSRTFNNYSLSLPPKDWVLQNNLVQCTDDVFIRGNGETGFRWEGNIFWNPDKPVTIGRDISELGVRVMDPKLVRAEDGLLRPSADSPIRNAALGFYGLDNIDMDGQERVIETGDNFYAAFDFDVGADEYSDDPILFRPLTQKDVGPDAP